MYEHVRGCFNCLWRKEDRQCQHDCDHADLVQSPEGVVLNCRGWVQRPESIKEENKDRRPSMLIKPKVIPADPTRVCRTCSHHDPDLHVCCANDYAIRDEEANTMSCSDWNPKKICITCGYFDPDTNQCWFEEHDMSEEESLTRTCESWEPRKGHDGPLQVVGKSCDNCGKCHPIIAMCTEHPDRSIWPPKENVCDEWVEIPAKLQPDDSLKMQAKETIGASVVNPDGVTKLTFGGTSLQELTAKQKKQEEQLPPGACCFNCEHRDKISLKCKLNLSDAVLTFERSQHEYCESWEREQDHGVTLRVADPEEDEKQKEAQVQERLIAKEKGYRRGYMVAELHMMCDAASQLLPDRKPQWERLRNTLEDALKAWWARNDQDKQQQEVSHE